MKPIAAAIAMAVLLAPAAALADYYVYCANGRIEVDSRNPEQMRNARGSGVCQMGPAFGFLSDAQSFAQRNFGGAGRSCSCR
jgi:opacity protein-like surface antigen